MKERRTERDFFQILRFSNVWRSRRGAESTAHTPRYRFICEKKTLNPVGVKLNVGVCAN